MLRYYVAVNMACFETHEGKGDEGMHDSDTDPKNSFNQKIAIFLGDHAATIHGAPEIGGVMGGV